MAETLTIATGSKEAKYRELIPQVKSMLEGEEDLIANMANVASMLHETFGFLWTGFYRVKKTENDADEILILGPFQGPLACTRIRKGKGVCGTAWERGETVVVEDVDKFPGHIACSSASRSEIVVPLKKGGHVVAVLDIDSEELATFDDTDKKFLEEIVALF
ncbi:MAG: GAF domain-containing protein [Prevotellaceae bacterium]|nr:GAF domain-containing protein [Prevotellaceae bacterium]